MLAVPDVDACRSLAGDLPADAPLAAIVAHPAVRATLAERLASFGAQATGSATRVVRAILLDEAVVARRRRADRQGIGQSTGGAPKTRGPGPGPLCRPAAVARDCAAGGHRGPRREPRRAHGHRRPRAPRARRCAHRDRESRDQALRRQRGPPRVERPGRVLPFPPHRLRRLHGRGAAHRPAPCHERRGAGLRGRARRHRHSLREPGSDPRTGSRGRRPAAHRAGRGPRLEAAPAGPAVLSERPPRLPALRGLRRSRACR